MTSAPAQADLCVIGGSEAGIAACIGAAAMGLSVVLVDDGDPDGLRNPDLVLEALRRVALDKPRGGDGDPWPAVRAVLARAAADRRHARLSAMNVRVVPARASFADASTVLAAGTSVRARRIVIAVGGRQPSAGLIASGGPARGLAVAGLGRIEATPRDVVVLGDGPEAVSAAQSLRRLGAAVALAGDVPLPGVDAELATPLFTALARDGVAVRTGMRPQLCRATPDGLAVTFTDGTVLEGSHVLLAETPVPALDDLGLERAGVATAGGRLVLDGRSRTTNPRVFAVGRAADAPTTAAGVARVGRVLQAAFLPLPIRPRTEAAALATATDPQIATVGLSEGEARARGPAQVWRWPLAQTGAGALATSAGFVKVVTDGRGRVLGAGLVGPDVRDLLGFWSLAVHTKLPLAGLADVPLPAPSWSESARAIAVSALAARLGSPAVRRALRLARWLG